MLSPEQAAMWASAAALQLSQGRDADDLALLGSMFTQLGDTLTTLSIQKSAVEKASRQAKTGNA